MENKRYKPLIDLMFWLICISSAVPAVALFILAFGNTGATVIASIVALVVFYLIISPLFGYVELKESSVYIKYGLVLKKEIPYSKIRGLKKDHSFLSNSMLSLKNALDHVEIKYNAYDTTTVSVDGNDEFIEELQKRIN